jgi:hypothetical protein
MALGRMGYRYYKSPHLPQISTIIVAIAFILGLIKTSVAKAGVPARRPKETKVSLTKGFDLLFVRWPAWTVEIVSGAIAGLRSASGNRASWS